MVTFQNNNAKSSGGAVYLKDNSLVVSKEYAVLHFLNNSAEGKCGAMCCGKNSNFTIDDKSTNHVCQ